jgi:galactitol-specific phosphotransferase system IIB component
MQAELDKEMNLYYVQLKGMIDDTENAKNAEKVGEYRYSRAKKIYRRLAKRLHPDINKKTNDNDILKEYWNRIVVAYHKSDIEELEDLEVLVRNTMEELGDVGFEIDYSDIEKRIERVERQINDIINTEPYIYGEILNSEERKEELKNNLQEEHDDYEQYLDTLSKSLDDMLREGGVEVIWKMN